jgi:peptidyl-prolyl cis-trans isomerase SurA
MGLFVMVGGVVAHAQTVFTVNGEAVSAQEFESIFKKNNYAGKKLAPTDVDDYLERYTNFKLKVKEAYAMGLDTNPQFTRELQGYRAQLAKPYLTDKETGDKLVREAYDRTNQEVRASHILIRIDANATPKDSTAAYQKVQAIKARLNKGEDFATLATELSEDPSAKQNKGDLGYFSALQMIYPFEQMAYTMPVGKTSEPFRTQFGYHILKVADKRPARGKVKVAHILIRTTDTDNAEKQAAAKAKIDELYKRAQTEDFGALAKQFSEDPSTKDKNGELAPFGTGRMVESFENAAFALQNDGDLSQPIKSNFGYHIIKRISYEGNQTFEQAEMALKQRVERDARSFQKRSVLVNKLKKEYAIKDYAFAKNSIIAAIALDTLFAKGNYAPASTAQFSAPLLEIDGKNYTQTDFAKFVAKNQTRTDADPTVVLNGLYTRFVDDMVMEYEDARLEEKYPEFNVLMQEYKDGILIFDLTDRKVWNKAVSDTTGLQTYYDKNKTQYMWGNRTEATIYSCANETVAKQVRKMAAKKSAEAIAAKINKENPLNVKITEGKYTKGDNELVDKAGETTGLSANMPDGAGVAFVKVTKLLKPEVKLLNEIKGVITSDYQTYLEDAWLKELKSKYKIVVNQEVLSAIKARL